MIGAADVELPEILRDIAAGRRNSAGDYWSRDYCGKAAAEIEALRAEVQRLQALTQWQPIATAPKGERVLVYNPLNGRRDIVNGWEDKSIFATHWMPLLEPPSEAASA